MSDIFVALKHLFRHEKIDDPPYPLVLHRFLSSDPDYAQVAKELQREVYDPNRVFEIWRAAVPKSTKPPYLHYPAPGKPGTPETVVLEIERREYMNRPEAEEALALLEMMGLGEEVREYYGIDEDDDE